MKILNCHICIKSWWFIIILGMIDFKMEVLRQQIGENTLPCLFQIG